MQPAVYFILVRTVRTCINESYNFLCKIFKLQYVVFLDCAHRVFTTMWTEAVTESVVSYIGSFTLSKGSTKNLESQ